MGWNSWDAFGVSVTEADVRENARFVAEHLKPVGYEYVVVDLGWYAPHATVANYKAPGLEQLVDVHGRLVPAQNKFPSSVGGAGLRPLGDYLHSLGLKLGLHIMRGMPWQAAEAGYPILGASATTDTIAQTDNGCPWFGNSVGVDLTRPGGQSYYDSLAELYAEWGVDFIKADDMNSWDGDGKSSPYRTDEIEALRRAIDRCGRPMVLSLSPGAAEVCNAAHLRRHANMWRISFDFWDNWEVLKQQFDRCAKWARYATPGHWPDADMLPLGKIGIRGEEGEPRQTNFTPEEQKTLLTLWYIFRSPLMFGGHLPESSDGALGLVANPEAIAVNQRGHQPREFARDESAGTFVWLSNTASGDGVYVALFNTSDAARTVSVNLKEVGIRGTSRVRDLWARADVGLFERDFAAELPPHGSGLYQVFESAESAAH